MQTESQERALSTKICSTFLVADPFFNLRDTILQAKFNDKLTLITKLSWKQEKFFRWKADGEQKTEQQ